MLMNQIEKAPADTLVAVDSQNQSLTYGELRVASRNLADKLGPDPRLVLLEGASTVDWLISYIGCLAGRHPVLIAPAGSDSAFAQLKAAFSPDILLRADNGYDPVFLSETKPKVLHPDLALMLSTSGSTGSAKCVRLSHANISANAASICEYLHIGAEEHGVANLPTHYSYGLSVVNSHLYAGATVLMTDISVIESHFWNFLAKYEATSFQGVPHTYDLINRIDFVGQAPKSLRYFTQAGGRLAPEKVQIFDQIARDKGWKFYVMYGQTEATARMAYMPPDELASHPASMGIPIPRGKFSLVDEAGNPVSNGEVGELVYEGPNVMMGYATSAEQLTLDPMPPRLVTGDLARVDDEGFYYITGRLSRFIKIFGNRIGLNDVEHILSRERVSAVATGVDDHLLIVTTDSGKQEEIGNLITSELKLPRQYFSVRVVTEYPLLPSGKIDYATLKGSIATPEKAAPRSAIQRLLALFRREKPSKANSVSKIFSEAFGENALDQDATFRSLGGDSLTYVSVALGLESRIDHLPKDWDIRSISELTTLEQRSRSKPIEAEKSTLSNLDTLRGLACLMVVVYHVVGATPNTGLGLEQGFLRWLADSLDYFRMPLFTAMAGFFYAAIHFEREGLWRFFQRRFVMLMFPALTITPIYWAVRHVVYGANESLLLGLLYGYLHLWYLYALMIILIVAGVVETLFKSRIWLWGAIVLLSPIMSVNMPSIDVFSLSSAANIFCYFAMGVLLYRIPNILRNKEVLAVALSVSAGALTLQQLGMREIAVSVTQWPYWHFCGGLSCVLVMLFLVPKIGFLGTVGIYSYTIYLWHPMANAGARFFLRYLHVNNIAILFFLGLLAGVIGPILFHILMFRFPRLSSFVIGRRVDLKRNSLNFRVSTDRRHSTGPDAAASN